MEHTPIVYLWVDGSDREYKKRYSLLVNSRNRDNDDLKYSLRSLETYMPWWKGKLYIVTDNQCPSWLMLNDNIIIVDHKDIIPENFLPTFNSHFIQRYVHNIEGIEDNFLLFDDDFILNNSIEPADFIKDGILINKFNDGVISLDNLNIRSNLWKASVFQTMNILKDKLNDNFDKLYINHSPYVLSKKSIIECNELFKNELEDKIFKFRDYEIATVYLYIYYYHIINNIPIKVTDNRCFFMVVKDDSEFISLQETIIDKQFVCFNDSFGLKDTSNRLKELYDKLLPFKSGYEY
jgi:hypothetical protein